MSDYALQLSETEIQRYQFMAQSAAQSERDYWTAAGIKSGAHVADVGCGPGAVSVVLAQAVGPAGTVRAVDRDTDALSAAAQLAEAAAVTNVTFSEGTATDTGLEPESVDVVMLRHVLAHNGGREQQIVDHLAGLVRPGGAVYLVDIEQTGIRVHPRGRADIIDEVSARYAEFHAKRGNDLSVGLRLGELLQAAGLADVEHRGSYTILRPAPGMRPPAWAARESMLADGVIDEAEVARWGAEFKRGDREGYDVTLFMPTFVAWGRKPAA